MVRSGLIMYIVLTHLNVCCCCCCCLFVLFLSDDGSKQTPVHDNDREAVWVEGGETLCRRDRESAKKRQSAKRERETERERLLKREC